MAIESWIAGKDNPKDLNKAFSAFRIQHVRLYGEKSIYVLVGISHRQKNSLIWLAQSESIDELCVWYDLIGGDSSKLDIDDKVTKMLTVDDSLSIIEAISYSSELT